MSCRDISNNQLRGRLLWSWADLEQADYVNVSGNNFSGEFPSSWSAGDGLQAVQTLCAPQLSTRCCAQFHAVCALYERSTACMRCVNEIIKRLC